MSAVFTALVLTFVQPAAYLETPDPAITAGELCTTDNKDFKQYRYPEHIPYCQRNVSTETKNKVMRKYGYDPRTRGDFIIDHWFALSLGGANTEANLWPQHKGPGATDSKNCMDQKLYNALSAGKITQDWAIGVVKSWTPEFDCGKLRL